MWTVRTVHMHSCTMAVYEQQVGPACGALGRCHPGWCHPACAVACLRDVRTSSSTVALRIMQPLPMDT